MNRRRTFWKPRYVIALVFLASAASFLAGLIKAWLDLNDIWWRTALSEGLSGTAISVITLLAYDRVKDKQAVRQRKAADSSLFAALIVTGRAIADGGPRDNGAAPGLSPEKIFDDLEMLSTQTAKTVSSALDTLLVELSKEAARIQALRQACIFFSDPDNDGEAGSDTSDDHDHDDHVFFDVSKASLGEMMLSMQAVQSIASPMAHTNKFRRESRLESCISFSALLRASKSVADNPALELLALQFAESTADLGIKNKSANMLEADLNWRPSPSFSRAKTLNAAWGQLQRSFSTVSEVMAMASDATDNEQVEEQRWRSARRELAEAVSGFPNLLGFYVNLERTTAICIGRAAKVLKIAAND